ncbi:MAG TPA: LysR family transcriptional regulator [Segeticoccus sp.]|uniref:LysR family transcriptional regulator n=1 Tax=Segeticoccus sp. TaxID=2706531 RepID=UPI002D8021CF|nr:LysR family transcriptional regulator [Segeticoccus sp.]HET8599709.1 LysR family transcriptional regulator [Segeticoccus sp.]
MDVEDLRQFVVVARTEHLTEAAAMLRTPQPTLSRAIRRVEDAVGAPLFERQPRGLRLNPAGRLMLAAVDSAVLALDRGIEQVHGLRDPESGTIRLAILHSVAATLVPEVIRAFRAVAAHVEFDLRQLATYEILGDLEAGQVELGISARADRPGFGWLLLERQQVCLAVPQGHRLAARTAASLAEVADEAFVGLQPSLAFRADTDELCRRAGFVPSMAFECTDLATVEGLVGAGLGVALLPVPVDGPRETSAGTVLVDLQGTAARRDIGLVWRAATTLPPPAERLRTFLQDWGA